MTRSQFSNTGLTLFFSFSFQAVEFEDGRVYLNSRTLGVQTTRQQAFSQDGCLGFNPGELATQLPEPGSTMTKWLPMVRNFGGCQVSEVIQCGDN